MDGEQRRGRLSSFVVGGLVGASAALAAARRRRRRETPRRTPQGLEAFEGAPCYREVIEREEDGPTGVTRPGAASAGSRQRR